MTQELRIKNSTLKLIKGDITDLDIEAFVFYAQHNLNLGSGFGTAISTRGGPKIQEELKHYGALKTTEAIVSDAGMLKTKYIIHAVGPRFKESNTEEKLQKTVLNTLKKVDEKDIKQVAFPPMGTGFYGIPLEMCAKVMNDTITNYLNGNTKIEEVIICAADNREYQPFENQMMSLQEV